MPVALLDVAVTESLEHRLSARLGPAAMRMWFASARLSVEDQTLLVAAPNRFVGGWIESRYREELRELAVQEIGPGAQVRVDMEGSATPIAPGVVREVEPAPPQRREITRVPQPSKPSLRHDLESFIVGPSNELAHTAACRLAEGADPRMHVLFIHGSCGLGKTHLLQGLCKRFARQHPDRKLCYTSAEEFTNQYIQAVKTNKLGEFRRRVRKLDLLAVDDVHFLANKTATQSEFLHTFDAIDLGGARLVMASDAHPKLIEQMGTALTSRFLCGMVVRIDAPDAQTRTRMVVEIARRRALDLPEPIARQIALQVTGSVREIEGALTKLSALASLSPTTQPIGHALLHQLFDSGSATPDRRPVRIENIIRVVCDELQVDRAQLQGRGRHRRVVLARSAIIHLARKLTTMSYPELAKAMGRPNHSTIVTAAQRIQGQLRVKQPLTAADTTLAPTVDQLVDHLHRCVQRDRG